MDIEDLFSDTKLVGFTKDLASKEYTNRKNYDKEFTILRKKYKTSPSKSKVLKIYNRLLLNKEIKENKSFKIYGLRKIGKSYSGVTVITVLTSPKPIYTKNGVKTIQKFTCGKDCAYCPNEPEIKLNLHVIKSNNKLIRVKTNNDIRVIRVVSYILFKDKRYEVQECSNFSSNEFNILLHVDSCFNIGDDIIGIKIAQPRSYLSSEPAVLRANKNNFDAVLQFIDRANALKLCGHVIDKIELLVLGGTWDHYPLEYQYEFIRDLGVQHIDDDILKYINRGCYLKHTIKSNYLWKQNGGKIDWHLMPDLPGSSYEKDFEMFRKLLACKIIRVKNNYFRYNLEYPELQADQMKIYPCEVTDWTKIKEWYDEGKYKPYGEDEEKLIEVIMFLKTNIFPWIRLNRIVRDIPNINILGGNSNVNLRQVILARMKKHNQSCDCIRCREIKEKPKGKNIIVIREYNAVKATEYFISIESPDYKTLYGFIRLRINEKNDDLIYEELKDCSFVRELHVYGQIIKHNKNDKNKTQHSGFGKKLLKKAEEISYNKGFKKVAIISGVGVRQYYEKNGYKLVKNYMIKELKYNYYVKEIIFCIIVIITCIIVNYM